MIIKKLSILLFLAFTVFVTNSVTPITQAAENTFKTSQTVSKVSYSEHDKVFYAYTQKDAQGRFWVMDIDPAGKTLSQLKTSLIGHTIDIYYTIDEEADGQEEIVKTVLH